MNINLTKKAYDKIMYIVGKCDKEVSGFGTTTYNDKTKDFTVHDIFLLDQEVGSAHTDIDAASLNRLAYQCTKNKVKGELNYWWHSHVNMSVFWSGQDKQTIEDLGKNGYIVASVFNKKAEIRSAVCAKSVTPFGESLFFRDEVSTNILDYYPANLVTQWDKEIKEKVKEKVYTPPMGNTRSMLDDWDDRYTKYWESTSTPKSEKTWAQENLIAEARAIGMSVEQYEKIVDFGTDAELQTVMNQLALAESEGRLHYSERSHR